MILLGHGLIQTGIVVALLAAYYALGAFAIGTYEKARRARERKRLRRARIRRIREAQRNRNMP